LHLALTLDPILTSAVLENQTSNVKRLGQQMEQWKTILHHLHTNVLLFLFFYTALPMLFI
jgi:hypothetical protein